MNITRYFKKTKWDAYMDGVELRPRLHTWAETAIFFISLILAISTLMILILPFHKEGVVNPWDGDFVPMVEEKQVLDGNNIRIFEDNYTEYLVKGPTAVTDEEYYTEHFEVIATNDRDETAVYTFLVGPLNSSESRRNMALEINDKRYSGNFTYSKDKNIEAGHFYSASFSDDPFSVELVYSETSGVWRDSPRDITLMARMVLDLTNTRREVNGKFLFYSALLALLTALATYFYNELFLIHRGLMSFSYHRSTDLEPTALYTFGHIGASMMILLVSIILFFAFFL